MLPHPDVAPPPRSFKVPPIYCYQEAVPTVRCALCGKVIKHPAHCFWMLPSGRVFPLHYQCADALQRLGGD